MTESQSPESGKNTFPPSIWVNHRTGETYGYPADYTVRYISFREHEALLAAELVRSEKLEEALDEAIAAKRATLDAFNSLTEYRNGKGEK